MAHARMVAREERGAGPIAPRHHRLRNWKGVLRSCRPAVPHRPHASPDLFYDLRVSRPRLDRAPRGSQRISADPRDVKWSGRRGPRVDLTYGSSERLQRRGKPRRRRHGGARGPVREGLSAAIEDVRRRRTCSRDVATLGSANLTEQHLEGRPRHSRSSLFPLRSTPLSPT